MKKFFLLIFCMMVFSPIVIAQATPPFQESDTYSVVVPKVEYILLDHTFTFHIHVYDTNDLLLTNDTVMCDIHVYNITGDHVIDDTMLFDTNGEDFYYTITGSDYLTQKGTLPFIVWCYDETKGGFASGDIEINDETHVGITDDTTQGISITIFILLATLFFLLFPKMYGKFSDHPITEMLITRGFLIISIYLMALNCGIIAELAVNSGLETSELFRYLWLFGWAGYLLMFATMAKTLFDVLELWNKLVNQRRGLE